MSELSTQFMVADPANAESTSESDLDSRITQARLRVQTIQRFQTLNQEIANILDPQEQKAARDKLDALAKRKYGNVWEVLRRPEVEVIPMMIGGKTKDELKQVLAVNGYKTNKYAEQMMDDPTFVTLPQREPVELIRLTVADLKFADFATNDQLNARAEKLGLELCPPEVGPWYRLQTSDQSMIDTVRIGMQPITDLEGYLRVFRLSRDGRGRWLSSTGIGLGGAWGAGDQFLFRLPLFNSEPTEADHE